MRTTSSTTLPVVFDALKSGLADLTQGMAQSGRDVHVDFVRPSNGFSDQIIIGDVESGVSQTHGIKAGRKRYEESYRVDIDFYVVRQEIQEATTCAVALFEVMRDWFAETPDLGTNIPTLRAYDIDWELSRKHEESQRGYTVTINTQPLVEAQLR